MKNIGIIGCGWLGLHLAKHLSASDSIFATVRSEAKKAELESFGYNASTVTFSDSEINIEKWNHLNDLDVIVITVPFSKRSDTEALRIRFENICKFIDGSSGQVLLMSSIGIYPQVDMEITEDSFTDDALEPNLILVERLVRSHFPHVTILRLGGLMGGNRVFSNYDVKLSDEPVNHVHYEDVCLVIEKLIKNDVRSKVYNVVAPLHPSKREVYSFQKGIGIDTKSVSVDGRKILTDKLITELSFTYRHPDPKRF